MQHICLNEVISDISASACDGGDDTEASAGANVLHSRTPQSRTNKLRSGRFVKCVVLINCNHTCERIRPRVCVCVCVVPRLSWGLYFGQSGLTDNSPPCWSHLLLRGRKLIGSSVTVALTSCGAVVALFSSYYLSSPRSSSSVLCIYSFSKVQTEPI